MKNHKQAIPKHPEWAGRIQAARLQRKRKWAARNRKVNDHKADNNRIARRRKRNRMARLSRRINRRAA